MIPYPIDTQLPWKNQRILLTGGAGFLGRHVYKELLSKNYHYIFVPRSKEYDLTNFQTTRKLIEWYRPDIIVHLAAQVGGISAIKNYSGKYYYDNMMMGLNLIETSRLYEVKKFVFIGSGCAYPKYGNIPFKEKELWDGYVDENVAPYAIAKKSLITMLQAYYDQYGLKSVSLIPTNLYGPQDHFGSTNNHVVPSLITKIFNAKNSQQKIVKCWGSGNQTRDFLYVSDAADAIVKSVMTNIDIPTTINLGSGKETSIKDIANKIIDLVDNSINIDWDNSQPEGQPRRLMDISNAAKLLNWYPNTNLQDGLKQTIQFYINNYK